MYCERQEELKEKIFLHEAGHLWGLCDQNKKPDSQRFCAHVGEVKIYHSVMNEVKQSSPDELTKDDKEMITQFSLRDDNSSKKSWDEYFKNKKLNPDAAPHNAPAQPQNNKSHR